MTLRGGIVPTMGQDGTTVTPIVITGLRVEHCGLEKFCPPRNSAGCSPVERITSFDPFLLPLFHPSSLSSFHKLVKSIMISAPSFKRPQEINPLKKEKEKEKKLGGNDGIVKVVRYSVFLYPREKSQVGN